MTDDNGISWFKKALKETMGDVEPLKDKNKTHNHHTYQQEPKGKPKGTLTKKPIYKKIQKENISDKLYPKKAELPFFYTGEIDISLSPECHIEYKDSSISSNIFKNIKHNKFHLDSYFDLHGYTVAEAAALTRDYIEYALNHNHRFIKIITGKGHAKLKNYLIYWLDEIPYILAYTTAPISHGGKGAVIIYLKSLSR